MYIPEDGPFIYDAIGNLTDDEEEGSKISWTPYGKVRTVKTKNDSITVKFRYDATGNRIEKRVEKHDTVMVTRYMRDASGNVMTIYKDTTILEQPIYGSSRLGIKINVISEGTQVLGKRNYELSNHLGNVLTVITDYMNMQSDSAWANVVSTSDYYSFGLDMAGRSWKDTTSLVSRYGFNGKEKDAQDEWGSTTYDYGFRIYNPTIAKFLSVDPLTKDYPWYTPYQFAGNKPISAIDLDGLEPVDVTFYAANHRPFPKLKSTEWYVIHGKIEENSYRAAFRYNIEYSNPGAYQTIADRNQWYKWANKNTSDNFWFSAADKVTSWWAVGAADNINLWFMNDQTENLLREANKYLLQENFKNFGSYAIGNGAVSWINPETNIFEEFGSLTGKELDNQMVVMEMTSLQEFLNTYKESFVSQNGQEAWNDLAEDVNSLFESTFLKYSAILLGADSKSNNAAQDRFHEKFGDDVEFDFMNVEHRIFQGQQMAEYLRTEAESTEAENKTN